MIEVEQRIVDDTKGDCFAACLASILEIPLEQVPNPHGGTWWQEVQCWLWHVRRLAIVLVHARDGQGDIGPSISGWPGRGLAIVSIPSVLFEGKTHAVVYDLAKHDVVWDPSPKRDVRGGAYPAPLRYWLLVPAAAAPHEGCAIECAHVDARPSGDTAPSFSNAICGHDGCYQGEPCCWVEPLLPCLHRFCGGLTCLRPDAVGGSMWLAALRAEAGASA